jgi:glycosyltransferase involved in cell wall biosynthesis
VSLLPISPLLIAGPRVIRSPAADDVPGARRARIPSFVGVVIPAHDEALRIARAIAAVTRALDHPSLAGTRVALVVVADASTDTTAERAQAAMSGRGEVIEIAEHSAGAARRAGFDRLIAASAGLDAASVWFATTDADTLVPYDWIERQTQWWRRGADAVAGLVTPISWQQQSLTARRRYETHMSRLGTGHGHPHVHGANLAMTGDAYCAAGGVPTLASGEDHALWKAIAATGRRALHAGDVVVETSTRREGRAPRGFSQLLRTLGATSAERS